MRAESPEMFEPDQPEELAEGEALELAEDERVGSVGTPPSAADLRAQRFILSFFGYDRGEVRAYLRHLAELLEEGVLGGGSAAASFESLGEEVTRILQTTTEAAEDLRNKLVADAQQAGAEAEQARAEAEQRLAEATAKAEDAARSIIQNAESRAADIASQAEGHTATVERAAEERAAAIVQEAKEEADRLVADAQENAAEMIQKAKEEAQRLHSTEEELRTKLAGLEEMLAGVRRHLHPDEDQ